MTPLRCTRILFVATLLISAAGPALAQMIDDSRLTVEPVVGGLSLPTAMEFIAPDDFLVGEKNSGRVKRVVNGVVTGVVLDLPVASEATRGLLGMALHPDFAANGYVYVYATVSTREARIIRLRERREAGGTGAADEVLVIRDHLPTRGGFHSGGGLKVGPDRKLYFGIGDNEDPEAAQDLSTLAGKISRINLDGSTPDDNPFLTPTGQRRATWAIGFRNPFRFCFAPDGRMFVLDVGSDGDGRREEINLVRAGLNCGWPRVEGKQDPEAYDPRYTDPIHDYHDGGAAPVGAVIYSGSAFPAEYQGDLFHLEFVLNRLYRVRLDGDSVVSHEVFVQGSGGPVDVAQGPDGALYYCEIVSGSIQRLAFVDADGERDPDVEASGALRVERSGWRAAARASSATRRAWARMGAAKQGSVYIDTRSIGARPITSRAIV